MRHIAVATVLTLTLMCTAAAQSSITPYYERNSFLFGSPGALKFGLYGNDNPALLSYVRQADLLVNWDDAGNPAHRWGLFAGIPYAGFGMVHEKIDGASVADYHLSLAAGDRSISSGISYGWTMSDNPLLNKSSLMTLGTLVRPLPFLSGGLTYTAALNTKGYEFAGDLAMRPLGNEAVTIFADYILLRTPQLDQNSWSAGAVVEALPGIRITGRYFNSDAFSLGVQFSLGRLGLETQAHYDGSSNHAYKHVRYPSRGI